MTHRETHDAPRDPRDPDTKIGATDDAVLRDWLDGELSTDAATALEARLADSAALRTHLARVRAREALLRGLPRRSAPDAIRAEVAARLPELRDPVARTLAGLPRRSAPDGVRTDVLASLRAERELRAARAAVAAATVTAVVPTPRRAARGRFALRVAVAAALLIATSGALFSQGRPRPKAPPGAVRLRFEPWVTASLTGERAPLPRPSGGGR